MRDVTIVILSQKLELLRAAIASVIATHAALDWCEFLVVDDGLAQRPPLFDRLRYVDGKKPFSFAGNVNVALRHVDPSRDVIVMNDDAQCVTRDGMSRLRRAADQRPRVGIVTPVFVPRGWQPTRRIGDDASVDEVWTEPNHFLPFPVGYFTRDFIQDVGLMDESFVGYGYDDNDYCLRGHLAGYELLVMPNVVMAHGDDQGVSSTFRDTSDLRERFLLNQHRFISKWCTSMFGLTPEQTDRLVWFFRYNFDCSPLPDRACELLGLVRVDGDRTQHSARR